MCHRLAYDDQVTIATFHLEGHAQISYQILWEEEGELTWDQFRDRVLVRFVPYAFNDYIGELIKLQLTGSVAEYQIQFETLLSKTKGIPRDQLTSSFVSGLKEYITYSVQSKEPQTVHQAVSYAKKYEQRLEFRKKRYQLSERRMHYNATPSNEIKNTGKTGSSWKGAGDKDATLKLNSLQQSSQNQEVDSK